MAWKGSAIIRDCVLKKTTPFVGLFFVRRPIFSLSPFIFATAGNQWAFYPVHQSLFNPLTKSSCPTAAPPQAAIINAAK